MAELLIWAAVALVSTGIVWKGSGLLESSSERLAAYYRLPDIVKGAIVVAIGSSFPELATTVISATLHGAFELGVAAIVGSALFNILVIPGLAGLQGDRGLDANRDLVYKEAQFYMIAVAVLLLAFAFAAIYYPVDGPEGTLRGEMTRWIALIPLALYGLYIFVQYQDTLEYDGGSKPDDISVGREWMWLGISLAVILVGVEGLVRAALSFGEILNTPSFLWGLTVVAAGTSIPDAFVSIRAARKGRGLTSIANVLGSNIFDLLVCIPAGVMIAGAAVIDFSVAAPMMGLLTAATIVLFLCMRTRLIVSPRESVGLLVLYAAVIVWIGAESTNLIDMVPGLPPPNGG